MKTGVLLLVALAGMLVLAQAQLQVQLNGVEQGQQSPISRVGREAAAASAAAAAAATHTMHVQVNPRTSVTVHYNERPGVEGMPMGAPILESQPVQYAEERRPVNVVVSGSSVSGVSINKDDDDLYNYMNQNMNLQQALGSEMSPLDLARRAQFEDEMRREDEEDELEARQPTLSTPTTSPRTEEEMRALRVYARQQAQMTPQARAAQARAAQQQRRMTEPAHDRSVAPTSESINNGASPSFGLPGLGESCGPSSKGLCTARADWCVAPKSIAAGQCAGAGVCCMPRSSSLAMVGAPQKQGLFGRLRDGFMRRFGFGKDKDEEKNGGGGGGGGGSGSGNKPAPGGNKPTPAPGGGGGSKPAPGGNKPAPGGNKPAPGGGNKKVQEFLKVLRSQLGKTYKFGTAGPNTFDCSGLVYWSANKVGLTSIPRTSQLQYGFGKPIKRIEDRLPGDLIFFGKSYKEIRHVGVWIGNNEMLEAPYTGAKVRVQSLAKRKNALTIARRIF